MPNENDTAPIGDAAPIELPKRPSIVERACLILAVSGGGAVALGLLATPTRTSGATRSSKVVWQQHQTDIRQAIDTQVKAASPANQAQPPTDTSK